MLVYAIIVILLVSIYIICKLEKYEVKYVKSNVDNIEYLVREELDMQEAADMLAKINQNIHSFVLNLYTNIDKHKKYKEYIEQLHNKIQNVVISESSAESSYTSYSINKGEQIVFCLRSKYNNQLHDMNLLMYVVLHELAHVGCPEYGHGELFKKIFAFFAKNGMEQGIYKKINFNSLPKEYCGLIISESII